MLVLLLLTGLAAWFFPQHVLTIDSGPVDANVMIVLGGTPDRAVRAAKLFKENEAPKIIVSGFGDCISNERILEKDGVPDSAITLEPKSRTTRENAEFSIALLRKWHATNAIIVTSWYHSRRALHTFEHYAPDIRFYSRPSYFGYPRKDSNRKYINGYIKSEYVKLLGYWVCYGVCPV
ncbi:MAG: YdcF family protein [Limisphaerales bacterium]